MFRKSIVLIVMCLMVIVPVAAQDPVTLTDAFGHEVVIEDTSRIVSIGGAVTEMIYALGMGDNVIAVDESSIYPEEATELPIVGYLRFMSAEPILAEEPTLVITTEDIGPVEVVDQLIDAGVTTLVVPAQDTLEGTIEKMEMIALALDKVDEGEALVEQLNDDIAMAEELRESVETVPRVMFVFLRGQAVLTVSGTATGADEMIRLAGAENAVMDYEGYQPITAEAVIVAAPDIILTTSNGVESIGGMEAFMALPGIANTPAAENGKIIAELDDVYLLGFTPRLGEAILTLTALLHDEIDLDDIGLTIDETDETDASGEMDETNETETSSEGGLTILDILSSDDQFSVLMEGIEIAQYGSRISGEVEYTFFAPNNDAFVAMGAGVQESLYSSPISVMAVFGYNFAPGVYTFDDLVAMDGEEIITFFGSSLTVSVHDDGTVGLIGQSGEVQIIESDLMASNGVVHVIDGVLVPAR